MGWLETNNLVDLATPVSFSIATASKFLRRLAVWQRCSPDRPSTHTRRCATLRTRTRRSRPVPARTPLLRGENPLQNRTSCQALGLQLSPSTLYLRASESSRRASVALRREVASSNCPSKVQERPLLGDRPARSHVWSPLRSQRVRERRWPLFPRVWLVLRCETPPVAVFAPKLSRTRRKTLPSTPRQASTPAWRRAVRDREFAPPATKCGACGSPLPGLAPFRAAGSSSRPPIPDTAHRRGGPRSAPAPGRHTPFRVPTRAGS